MALSFRSIWRSARCAWATSIAISAVAHDLTERKRAAEEHARLQERIIQAQAATLAELSTPLIPISDHVVVMPLIGAIDSDRARQVLETLLHGIERSHARVAILDITGVPLVDTQVAKSLIVAAQAVRLLGARIVLTGIRPEVAQTLVGLGVDLGDIVTHSTLQSGIAYATNGRSEPRTKNEEYKNKGYLRYLFSVLSLFSETLEE